MKIHHIGILIILILSVSIFILLKNEFKKDLNRVRERYSKAESYFGKEIILDSDTLEVIDYRLGQFMLSDRTWIGEDVVIRIIKK